MNDCDVIGWASWMAVMWLTELYEWLWRDWLSSMSDYDVIGWALWMPETWLAEPHEWLRRDWVSPMNHWHVIGWAPWITKTWLAELYEWLRRDWLSPMNDWDVIGWALWVTGTWLAELYERLRRHRLSSMIDCDVIGWARWKTETSLATGGRLGAGGPCGAHPAQHSGSLRGVSRRLHSQGQLLTPTPSPGQAMLSLALMPASDKQSSRPTLGQVLHYKSGSDVAPAEVKQQALQTFHEVRVTELQLGSGALLYAVVELTNLHGYM